MLALKRSQNPLWVEKVIDMGTTIVNT